MGRIAIFGSDRKQEYILAVKYDNREEDQTGLFSEVTANAGQTAIWQYASRDLSLIANLIMTSSGGDQLEDVIPSSALMGKAGEITNERSDRWHGSDRHSNDRQWHRLILQDRGCQSHVGRRPEKPAGAESSPIN